MIKNKKMTIALTILCVIVGIVTSVQFNTIASHRESGLEHAQTLDSLRAQLFSEREIRESREEEIRGLREQLTILEEGALSEQGDILREQYRQARIIAGFTDVVGPGVIITIGENANRRIEVALLIQLINDLRMAGAQAISINNERIVAMSAIEMGDYFLVVNRDPIPAPYTIKAIGDLNALEIMLDIPGGVISFLEQTDWFVNVEYLGEVQIPRVRDTSPPIDTDLITAE